MDVRTYDMKSLSDVIDLAQYIQTKIYWNDKFYLVDDMDYDLINYKEFWEVISQESSDKDITKIKIDSSATYDVISYY